MKSYNLCAHFKTNLNDCLIQLGNGNLESMKKYLATLDREALLRKHLAKEDWVDQIDYLYIDETDDEDDYETLFKDVV